MCSELIDCVPVFSVGIFVGGVFALRYLAPIIYRPVIEMEKKRADEMQARKTRCKAK